MLSIRIINGDTVCEVTDEDADAFGSNIETIVDCFRRCVMGLGFHPDTVGRWLCMEDCHYSEGADGQKSKD